MHEMDRVAKAPSALSLRDRKSIHHPAAKGVRQKDFSRENLYTPPPPLPPFLAKRHFSGEGGGGVYFEAPRGRNFIRPPPPFIHPPPLEGYFQGWGCIKFGPVVWQKTCRKKVTKRVPKTKKVIELPLPTSFCGTLNTHFQHSQQHTSKFGFARCFQFTCVKNYV